LSLIFADSGKFGTIFCWVYAFKLKSIINKNACNNRSLCGSEGNL